MPSIEVSGSEKAIGIRDVGKEGDLKISVERSSMASFVSSNTAYLRSIESKGISDLRSYIGNNRLPITLSFSGGKDSLACFGLLSRASNSFVLLFVDTGLEFPRTVEYVRSFAKKHHQRIIIADAGNAFWDHVKTFGPPAKDFRWCCKVCKLAPLTDIIERNFPAGTITIEGNRGYESYARSRTEFVEKNPFVPNQITLNPILDWRAVDVWGYINWRGLEYNSLYDEDFERVGCYLCPSCLESEWKNTKRLYPQLYKRWDDHLKGWAKANGSSDEFIKYGFWRWKVFPRKMMQLSQEMHLKIPEMRTDRLSLNWVKGVSQCNLGGYSAEGILTVPRKRDFSNGSRSTKDCWPSEIFKGL